MAEEKREDASEPEVPVMDQVGNVMSSMKHLMVSALAHANYGLNSLKSTFVTVSSFDQHEERVLSPVTDLKLNIEQSVLGVSKSINDTYPFLSSMAKAHQWNVTAQVGLGSGLLATVAFKSVIKRRVRFFLAVSLVAAADTYCACELIKYQHRHQVYKPQED